MIPPATHRQYLSEIEKDHYGQALRAIEAVEYKMSPVERGRAARTKRYLKLKLEEKGVPKW